MSASRTLVYLVLALAASSCSTLGRFVPGVSHIPDELKPAQVEPALERSRALLDAGDNDEAMRWMLAASATPELPPALKRDVRELLERAARARMDELSGDPPKPAKLARFLRLELPRQIAVEAVLRAADAYRARGDGMEAFRLVKRLDQKFPTHHLRSEAGRILVEVGLAIAEDDSRFLFLFPRRDRAKDVLDYLVVNYPSERRCDEAYATLAWLYEVDESWEAAIERHEDLLLYHADSPLAVESEARVPKLRLISIASPEYDRQELVRARGELESWLQRHPGAELTAAVRLDLAECYLRLHESDMGIARFYRRVDNAFGARFHASRAAEEARLAGDEGRRDRALAFLEALPPATLPAAAPRTSPGALMPPPPDEVQGGGS